MKRRVLGVLIAVLSASATAQAQPSDARKRAQEVFALANAAFESKDYATAARRYEEAAVIAPHPATLLNAAEAWELAREPARAAELCDRVLSEPYLDPKYHEAATLRLDRVKGQIATLDLAGPATTRVRVDDGAEGTPRRVRVMPGRHTLSFLDTSTNRTHRGAVEVGAGETRRIDARVPEQPPPAPPRAGAQQPSPERPRSAEPEPRREESRGGGPPAGTWIAFGVAAAGLGVGGAFGLLTLRARDDFDASPTTRTRDTFYRDRAIANVGFLVAGVAAVTGGVIWVTSSSSTSARVGFAPRSDGAGLVSRWSF